MNFNSNGTCEVCGGPSFWSPCMDCVRARARSATTGHRCVCGRKRIESAVKRVGSRTWISCERCLGTVKQLS